MNRFLGRRRISHDIFGYRKPGVFEMKDYTIEEQTNRSLNANLFRLVYAYRNYGHLAADLDPLGIQKRRVVPELDPGRYGIPENGVSFDLSGIIHVNKKNTNDAREHAKIETILDHLRKTYCGKIAYEYRYIPNISERRWFSHMVESFDKKQLSKEEKLKIFSLLSKSEVFDHFMANKFASVKRYGLEGAEGMMVALNNLFKTAAQNGLSEAVVCMPHRGRLNLLTDLLEYSPTSLFHKIRGNSEFPEDLNASGDVISHIANTVRLNYEASISPLKVTMLHNPSHLEAVNPVAMGTTRAKQLKMLLEKESDKENCQLGDKVVCIQLHGDAAFTGQGVVMESLGLSQLPHFTSGGSIHVIVNNQIGYTTPAMNSRSSIYATDIGKMINAPVIHVNGEFPEEIAYAAELAFQYRQQFRKDVILDLITYRRWGHNELDEPAFTQPSMYKNIRSRKSVPKLYEEKLIREGVLQNQQEVDLFRKDYFDKLDGHFEASKTFKPQADHLKGKWSKMTHPTKPVHTWDTGVNLDTLIKIGNASIAVPQGFEVHPRLLKHHIQSREAKMKSGEKLDWATAEALAFGSMLLDGNYVRISGQDVGRGTFSQRHVMLVDQQTEQTIVPLNSMAEKQGKIEVANSSLSEFAVLGFEWGMSAESPNFLNIWEAQFGDFFNGAQVIIDTYINSAEQKWLRQSGLVMLLPHGYDGTGPEHSSCRLERFLQLSDDLFDVNSTPRNPNWHVINPTTPAQYFHALRRQMKRPFRKPLIVVGPKTLLKSSNAVSTLKEMEPGTSFQPVLNEENVKVNAERVVFLSGKLYYDLVKERSNRKLDDKIAFVRLEELSPFPVDALKSSISQFANAKEFVWCQEEPQNMGAWTFAEPRLNQLLPNNSNLKFIGRLASAAPATGISSRHKKEQASVLDSCLRF